MTWYDDYDFRVAPFRLIVSVYIINNHQQLRLNYQNQRLNFSFRD